VGLARFGFALQGGLLLALLIVLWPGGHSLPPRWWTGAFLSALGWVIVTGGPGLFLAVFMRCDACGRRPTIVWDPRYKEPYASSGGVQRIRDFYTAPELRLRKFQCAHCKQEFALSGYRAPNPGMQPTR
jgi:hypothetical protein